MTTNWYKRQVSSNFLSFLSKRDIETPVIVEDEEIDIDKKLNFSENISSEVCFKANSKIILTRMGELVPEKTLLCPFSSVILMLFLSFSFCYLFSLIFDFVHIIIYVCVYI